MYLYHATRASNLASILNEGLSTKFYGQIHGRMEYGPPESAVYLSIYEDSNNLNTALFDECSDDDQVVVLRIDADKLDSTKYFPDDAFFYMLDDLYCEEADEMTKSELKEFVDGNYEDFAERFGFSDLRKAKQLLNAFCKSDGSMQAYADIAKKMGLEYLVSQGETAYLGNIAPEAILDWKIHPASPNQERGLSVK